MGNVGRDKVIEDDQILRAIPLHPDPVVNSTEVGELVGMTQQGAYSRLDLLNSKGLVHSTKKGNARLYWLTREGKKKVAKRYLWDNQDDE